MAGALWVLIAAAVGAADRGSVALAIAALSAAVFILGTAVARWVRRGERHVSGGDDGSVKRRMHLVIPRTGVAGLLL